MSTENDNVVEPSYLEMSDEDILNAPPPFEEDNSGGEVDSSNESAEEENSDTSDEDDEDDEQEDNDASTSDESENDDAGTAASSVDEEDNDSDSENADTKEAPAELDYKAEYERILAPFKANGREITPKSVDDAITLMQMGANYNKKMAALKPNLKLMKLLENNGMLSEEKIGFLIELERKSPDAINKLVNDSGINPMDFDAEKAGEYTPKIHTVDDREMELDTVLDELQSTPTYNQTLHIVSKEWDGASKQIIATTPQLLRVINDHVASGIYELISEEVDRERVFGRLNGLSDLEAYRQVGDAIQARGGFNHLGSSQGKSAPVKPVVVVPKPKVNTDKLNDKRRAASSTKAAAPSIANKEFSPLAMSDDEFSKLSDPRYR